MGRKKRPVPVRKYTKKDGTKVKAHNRSQEVSTLPFFKIRKSKNDKKEELTDWEKVHYGEILEEDIWVTDEDLVPDHVDDDAPIIDYDRGRVPWGIRKIDLYTTEDLVMLIIRIHKKTLKRGLESALGFLVARGVALRNVKIHDERLRKIYKKNLNLARTKAGKVRLGVRKPKADRVQVSPIPDDIYEDPADEDEEEFTVNILRESQLAYQKQLEDQMSLTRGIGGLVNVDAVDIHADQENVYLVLAFRKRSVIAGVSAAFLFLGKSLGRLALQLLNRKLGGKRQARLGVTIKDSRKELSCPRCSGRMIPTPGNRFKCKDCGKAI